MTERPSKLSRLLDSIPAGFYSNAAWQYVTSFAGSGLNFVYILVTGALLGVNDFGRLSVALACATVTFQLVELRLHEAVIRYVSEFRERAQHAEVYAAVKLFLLADAMTGVAAFALVLAVAPLAARYLLKDAADVGVIVVAGLVILFQNVSTATSVGLCRTFGDFRMQAIISSVGGLSKVLLTVLAIRTFGLGVVGVLLVAAASNLAMNAVLAANALRVVARHVPAEGRAPLSLLRSRFRDIRRFVVSTYVFSLSAIPTKDLDVALVGYFAVPAASGVYKVAKTFIVAITMLVDPAFFVIYPQLTAMWIRREASRMIAFVQSITLILAAASVVVALASFVVVPAVITQVAGEQYAAAGSVFRVMIWALLFWAPLIWVNPMLLAADRPDIVTKASLIAGAVAVALQLLLIPTFEAIGAAVGYVCATALSMIIALTWGVRAGVIPPRFSDESTRREAGRERA
ncbi:MAG: oligosaccharide flippase family protein [Thermoanaerobaculia bacterium]